MSVFIQKAIPSFTGAATAPGRVIIAANKATVNASAAYLKAFSAFIKSPANEYIEAVTVFMKHQKDPFAFLRAGAGRLPAFIELRGNETLLCEGVVRIIDYSGERIVIATDGLPVAVSGERLNLRHLSAGRIAVDGRIDSVEFIQSDR